MALSAALCSAIGQILPSEAPIQGGLATLRLQPEVMISLTGSDRLGPRTTNLNSNGFFKWNPLNVDQFAKCEINDYPNNVHSKRITADGATVWGFDYRQNLYTTLVYGSYSGAPPSGFRTTMFDEMNRAAQGPAGFIARLLQETFSGTVAQYRTWMPGAKIATINPGETLQDPVNTNRSYVAGLNDTYVVYWYQTRINRSAVFHLAWDDTTKTWNLSDIYYTDLQNMTSSAPRVLDWHITVYTGALPSSTDYVFVPPSSSRAITNVRGQGGG